VSRMKTSTRLAAGILGLLTSVSVAFFIGSILGDGSFTGNAGSGGTGTRTVPIKVSFPSGQLTPGNKVSLTADVENNTSKAVTFTTVKPEISTGAAGCTASWFKVVAEGTSSAKWNEALAGTAAPPVALTYEANTTGPLTRSAATTLKLEMTETGADQSACEGAPITVRMKLA
jgi:hypothetical protein